MGTHVSSRKLLATGRWKNVPGNGSNLAAISHSAKHGRYESSSWKLPAAGRWKNVPGKVQISSQSHVTSLIVMDLGVDECNGSLVDSNTTTLQQHSTESSGKFPATGRWRNVPGKLRISLQSHMLPNMGDQTSVPGNFPQRGDARYFLEMFKSRCISQSAKYGRSNVSSGKLPATGRWGNVPGKVQISMHLTYP